MLQKSNDNKSKTSASKVAEKETFFKPLIQPKLTINEPNDEFEKEADAMADHVMRMTDNQNLHQPFFKPISSLQRKCAHCEEEEKMQRKIANDVIQRQDTSTTETPTTQTEIPHLTLDSSSLFQGTSAPDYLALRQPFFSRNIPHLWDADSALHVWQYNFDFFRKFGLSNDLSTTLTNFTAPRFIDSQLKAGNPTWWEITDRELNTSTISASIPVLEFNANFSPVAPSWLKSILGGNRVQRKCADCEGEEKQLQRKEGEAENNGSSIENYVASLNGKGTALPAQEKDFFESRFAYDFSDVKIHSDAEAVRSAQSINALAFTHGNNIVFGSNQYSPNTDNGKRLLAHELTHVVQQNGKANRNIQCAPNPPGWDELHKYKHPGGAVVRITHFVMKGAGSDPFNDYAAKAKSMLQEHGLGLDVYEAGTLDFPRPLQDIDDVKELRMAAHKKFQDKQNDDKARLPVISAMYSEIKGYEAHNLNGQTISGTDWLPFVLLNASNKSSDKVTLLHEIGHAANVPGLKDVEVKSTDAVQNFMLYGDNRTDMLKQQVIAIAKAYFSG